MTFRFFAFTLFILLISSCDSNKIKRVKVGDTFVEGEIISDTIYNGLIKFYDTTTKQIVQSANYKLGILDGESIVYHSNGNIKLKVNYQNGKILGNVTTFDSSGEIIETQNIYYDLRVGPSIKFKNKQISKYSFYSFDNKKLLYIDYDSVKGKNIEKINDSEFFFWHLEDYTTSESDEAKIDLFLYLPNPPNLNFKYSVCIIDNNYNIKKTVQEFSGNTSFEVINLDSSLLKSTESFAIRLTIDNEFDDNDETKIAYMFKRI